MQAGATVKKMSLPDLAEDVGAFYQLATENVLKGRVAFANMLKEFGFEQVGPCCICICALAVAQCQDILTHGSSSSGLLSAGNPLGLIFQDNVILGLHRWHCNSCNALQ